MKHDRKHVIAWRGVLRVFASAGLAAWIFTVPGTAAPPSTSHEVLIDNFTFHPGTVTVSVGTTVTWTNHDDVPHTVVDTEQKFKSSALDTDKQFSHTFAAAGTYKYYCSIHPRMTAEVIVK